MKNNSFTNIKPKQRCKNNTIIAWNIDFFCLYLRKKKL